MCVDLLLRDSSPKCVYYALHCTFATWLITVFHSRKNYFFEETLDRRVSHETCWWVYYSFSFLHSYNNKLVTNVVNYLCMLSYQQPVVLRFTIWISSPIVETFALTAGTLLELVIMVIFETAFSKHFYFAFFNYYYWLRHGFWLLLSECSTVFPVNVLSLCLM